MVIQIKVYECYLQGKCAWNERIERAFIKFQEFYKHILTQKEEDTSYTIGEINSKLSNLEKIVNSLLVVDQTLETLDVSQENEELFDSLDSIDKQNFYTQSEEFVYTYSSNIVCFKDFMLKSLYQIIEDFQNKDKNKDIKHLSDIACFNKLLQDMCFNIATEKKFLELSKNAFNINCSYLIHDLKFPMSKSLKYLHKQPKVSYSPFILKMKSKLNDITSFLTNMNIPSLEAEVTTGRVYSHEILKPMHGYEMTITYLNDDLIKYRDEIENMFSKYQKDDLSYAQHISQCKSMLIKDTKYLHKQINILKQNIDKLIIKFYNKQLQGNLNVLNEWYKYIEQIELLLKSMIELKLYINKYLLQN
ncbi:hypothetical protein AB837_00538 [bacterium AB1]|nr:hypothetical protein AB837_00538 [bacterium AB1]